MAKLHDKDDPNQVKEDQSPYGDESTESSDDPSPAAMHGRIVRLETNAKHVATNEGVARVEVKIARVEGKVDTVKAELSGKIDTGKAETDAKLAWIEKLLYATITLLIFVIIKDSPTVSGLFAKLLAKLFS